MLINYPIINRHGVQTKWKLQYHRFFGYSRLRLLFTTLKKQFGFPIFQNQPEDLPIPLKNAAAAVCDGEIILFGGTTTDGSLNDLAWSYPLATTPVQDQTTPNAYVQSQNYPNPFNPVTKINYTLPVAGRVTIHVYDLLGKKITALVDQYKREGAYEVEFNGSDLPSGIYFYKMMSGNYTMTKKILLMK